ncbi:MAG: glycosyltransferase family 39 protein [Pseudomonadota bacterium]
MTETRRPFAILLAVLVGLTVYRALVLHFSGLTLYVDEAQYWNWAQSLDWGYYSKPPVIAAVIAATTAVCGDGELCIKSGALLIYPLTALLIFALTRRLSDARTALWAALVFITLPGVAFSSLIISTDVPLFLCWTAALYGFVRALESNRWRWWLLTGLAAGAGLLTKYTMGIFALSAMLYLLVTPNQRHQFKNLRLYFSAAIAAALFAPNILWNAQHGWPTLQHTAAIAQNENGGLHWDELFEFLGGQAALIGPVLFVALIVLLFSLRRWRKDPTQRLLACFTLPFLLLISAQALFGRANANWAAMTYAAGTVWLVLWLLSAHRFVLIAAIVSNLALAGIAYHYHALTRLAGIEMTAKSNVYKRIQGWDRAGAEVRTVLAANPGARLLTDDRDLIAELLYYARPESQTAVMWNPQGVVVTHYHLSTTMQDKTGQDFVYVSRSTELAPAIRDCFSAQQMLGVFHTPIARNYALDLSVWRLDGFKGYAACG